MPQLSLAAFVFAVVSGATYWAFQLVRAGSLAFWLAIAIPYAVLAGIGVYRAQRDGVMAEWLTPRGGDFSLGFVGAAASFGVAYAVSRFYLVGTPREGWLLRIYLQFGDPADLQRHWWTVMAALFMLALCEEIVWRGLVQSLLAERFGSRWAWVYGAVAYAGAMIPTMWALRLPGGAPNPLLVVAALALGLVSGFVMRKWGRLPPLVVAHALFAWAIVMMFRLLGSSV